MTDDLLRIDDEDRYSRLRLISWWNQEKLAAAKVLVVGAGALGNEVLKNLALLGIGRIFVIDFDEIESSNLTRSVLFRAKDAGRPKCEVAADALSDLNPDVTTTPIHGNVMTELGLGLIAEMDVVIGCLDNREARLWVNRACWKATTPWIDGGIQEISGVVKVYVPPDGSCYECTMTENDYRLINLRYSCPLLRAEDLQAGKVPTAPTISSMIGGLQTQEALKLIHGMDAAEGEAMIFNGVANRFYRSKLPRREDCLSHDTYPQPVELDLSARENTAAELFAAARKTLESDAPLELALDRDLVIDLTCSECDKVRRVMRPSDAVGMKDAQCCDQTMQPNMVHAVVENSDLAAEKLCDLTIPILEWVRIQCDGDEQIFSFAKDREQCGWFD
ncbi:MAG: ThiF family adenylyltransferase [Planctomycetales bacterium]